MKTPGKNPKSIETFTSDIARLITSSKYDELPETVVKQAKLCFLDFLSVTLRGSQTNSARIIQKIIRLDHLKSEDCANGASVIGDGKCNTLNAALANGVSAHALDLDDGHRLAQLHPGACVIPAALALAESFEISGKDFINAIVVGYDVTIKLGMILNPQHRDKGFHSTGTCGTIGAAAAASKILNLNEEMTLNALGLAGTQAAGLLESDHTGSMGKHLHAGKAAQSGVFSALLAKEGFTGAKSILEGEEGLFNAMGDINVMKNENMAISQEKYEIERVYFKKYPVCRHLHSSIDAVTDIIQNNTINSCDITNITVQTYKIAASHNNYHPETSEGIRQSLPVTIALTLKKGDLRVEDISKASMSNEVIANADKVSIKLDHNLNDLYPNKRPSAVTIKCKDDIYTKRVDLAKGEPENPFKKEELLNKFKNLNPHTNIHCLDVIEDLENKNLKNVMINLSKEFK